MNADAPSMNVQRLVIAAPYRRGPWCCQQHRLALPSSPRKRPYQRSIHNNSFGSNNDRGVGTPSSSQTTTSDATDRTVVAASTIPKMGRGVRAGQYATTTRIFTGDEIERFGRLIRDLNPLHSSSMSSSLPLSTPSLSTETSGVREGSEIDTIDGSDDDLLDLQRSILEEAGLIRYRADDDGVGGSSRSNKSDDKASGSGALVHGIFVSSLFSSIFASIAPGCVYANQSLDFRAPVFAEETVVGCIRIARIRSTPRRKPGVVVECHTRVYKVSSSSSTSYSSSTSSSAAAGPVTENHHHHHHHHYQQQQQQGPVEAQLVVGGSANVWLPMGYTSEADRPKRGNRTK